MVRSVFCATRPVSLLRVVVTALRAAVCRRLIGKFEDHPATSQYARRRGRGTESRALELSDSVWETREKGECTCVASTDDEAAFNTVPHKLVLGTLREWKADPRVLQVIRVTHTRCTFCVRL